MQLIEEYEALKNLGILQLQFVFKNNIVFLRTQKPEKFGDDISKFRADYVYTNQHLKESRTFAQGRFAHGFRNTFPIFNTENEHIGAMEVSFSSDVFQDYLDNVSKIHTHFIVNKNIFESTIWSEADLVLKYMESAENSDFMLALSSFHNWSGYTI